MKENELINVIASFCPVELAEEWDNCGYQISCANKEINRVLVSLEITNSVINEAIENEADLIITHHPLLFESIRCVDSNKVIGNYMQKLIKNNISVYSCHTNFDKAPGGNNDYLGKLLELEHIRPFDRDNGFCRKGETPFAATFIELIHKAAEAFGIDEKYFRCVGNLTSPIDTVGWCTGAGAEFIMDAVDEGCDLYITGDVKYHEAQLAKESGFCVLDAGHYGSEKIFTENMADLLRECCGDEDIEIMESAVDINPFE